MNPRFQDYGKAVCQHLRHATGREKKSVQAELVAHLEDHAQALREAGYEEEQARQAALEAMGNPAEVGKALDREFPRLWYVLSQVSLLALVLAALFAAQTLWPLLSNLAAYRQARTDPMHSGYILADFPELSPLDIQQDLPGGAALRVFGSGVEPSELGEGYDAYIATVIYPKTFFIRSQIGTSCLDFSWDTPDTLFDSPLAYSPLAGTEGGVYYCTYKLLNISPGTSPTALYDHYGTTFRFTVPLPWEEVME